MKTNTELLQPDTFYHVYNRGINGETIFKEERNYPYFLKKFADYIEPVADTYAYCLLGNHFHFLIQTKSETEILENLRKVDEASNLVNLNDKDAVFHLSNQFAKLFNSYTQSINKAYGRTGGLFETPFRRIEVTSDAYFSHLVWYIHANPQKHGFVDDFRNYPHSSYHSHLQQKPTKLKRTEVLDWFGDVSWYEKFHAAQQDENSIKKLIIEF